jgi:hypothetical protein
VFGLRGHEIRLELDLGSVFDVIVQLTKLAQTWLVLIFIKEEMIWRQTPHLRGLLSVTSVFQ